MFRVHKWLRLALALGGLIATSGFVVWQTTAAGNSKLRAQITRVDDSQFPTVKVHIAVKDARGQPATLEPSLLTLVENGITVPALQVGESTPTEPLTTLLLLDTSSGAGQSGALAAEQAAAHTLIDRMPAEDAAGVVQFNSSVQYVQPVTHDRDALRSAAANLVAQNNRAVYDAIARGVAILNAQPGRSAMSGLYLQPDTWDEERKINCWLKTHVTHVNRGHREVELATDESIRYDRLILASGSSSVLPPISCFGRPGTFGLREAEEAMEIRAYVQKHRCRTAVVAGGGLLGLEAAYALHQIRNRSFYVM